MTHCKGINAQSSESLPLPGRRRLLSDDNEILPQCSQGGIVRTLSLHSVPLVVVHIERTSLFARKVRVAQISFGSMETDFPLPRIDVSSQLPTRRLVEPEVVSDDDKIFSVVSISAATKRQIRVRSNEIVRSKDWILFLVIVLLGCPSMIHSQTPSDETLETTEPSIDGNWTEVPTSVASESPTTAGPQSTTAPTVTSRPTSLSSSVPTFYPTESLQPTGVPSAIPTDLPTFSSPIVADARFRQKFLVGNGRLFNDNEVAIFETLYEGYTKNFAQVPDPSVADSRILTTCVVDNQEGLDERRFLRNTRQTHSATAIWWSNEMPSRRTQEVIDAINVDYTMTYSSIFYNVSSYPILFQNWINQNLETVTNQMQVLQLNVTAAQTASRLIVRTPSPTISAMPSDIPTSMPTTTPYPSRSPTERPTPLPSVPSTNAPDGNENGVVIIAVSLVIGILIVVIGILIYCMKLRHKRTLLSQEGAIKNGQGLEGPPPPRGRNESSDPKNPNYGNGIGSREGDYPSSYQQYADPSGLNRVGGAASPSESRVSHQSLLSAGDSMAGDSCDEADTTGDLADEFDQYKDQNLEKMRAEIEGNLEGCDGMMSQAVARALIDEDDLNFGATDYLWGGDADVTGPEIEASALGDVMDWLKRHEVASVEEKRAFMQETLNRMVASVRHGVLGPDDASRSIHECAALLGLQLAADIPVTTVVISGMRKNAAVQDIVRAFSEFGTVSTAAVAPNERGYGILRFKNNESVDIAMKKFRKDEVVVQDVAVQLQVIKPGSLDDGLSNGSS